MSETFTIGPIQLNDIQDNNGWFLTEHYQPIIGKKVYILTEYEKIHPLVGEYPEIRCGIVERGPLKDTVQVHDAETRTTYRNFQWWRHIYTMPMPDPFKEPAD